MKKILLVGQLPPPFHGQAVINKLVFDAKFSSFESLVLPMQYSRSIDEVGAVGYRKVVHLFLLIFRTWKLWIVERPDALYYPPASANRVPVLRDVFYLGMTRFLFPKTVFHFHAGGLGDYLESIGLIGKMAKFVYRKPDLAIELYNEPDSPGKYLAAKMISVIPNGLAVDDLNEKNRVESAMFTLLFIGSLREDKGVLDLIYTIEELKKRGKLVEIKIAGGWVSRGFEREVKALTEKLGVAEQFHWLGVIEGAEKWEAFRTADCFFFPTFYHAEKFPLVLIEALGMGLPVVSTYWRGIPELLEGSDAAFLSTTHAIALFADAIETLASDRQELIKMSENAKSHYEKNYTLEIFLNGMEKHLSSTLHMDDSRGG